MKFEVCSMRRGRILYEEAFLPDILLILRWLERNRENVSHQMKNLEILYTI